MFPTLNSLRKQHTNWNTTMRSTEVSWGLGNCCHSQVIKGTCKECRKCAGEGDGTAPSSTTHGHAHNVLLSYKTLNTNEYVEFLVSPSRAITRPLAYALHTANWNVENLKGNRVIDCTDSTISKPLILHVMTLHTTKKLGSLKRMMLKKSVACVKKVLPVTL